jgi:arylsulfatase A-like enzyme
VLSWLLLAPLTALPVLAGSSDVGTARLLAEVVGLATLGIAVALLATGGIARAAPWAAVGVVAPIVSALGLPWSTRVGLEAAAWALALGLVGRALLAVRRKEPAVARALLALLGLGLLQLDPLALGFLACGAPLCAAAAALERRGPLPQAASVLGTVLLGVGLIGGARAWRLHTQQLADPAARVLDELAGLRPPPSPAPLDAPPIVVISVDTLRTDAALEMQSVQALMDRGAHWPRAMATSSWTVPSLVSLWTGVAPGEHGAGADAGGRRVFTRRDPGVPHLAAVLADAGYTTAAFATNPLVTAELGLADGFATWRHATATPPHPLPLTGHLRDGAPEDADRVVGRARGWLRDAPDRGFLLWVHLFDPHIPYTHAEDPWISRRAVEPDAPQALRDETWDAYLAEVAAADEALGTLLADLETRGFWEAGGVVVFTSDHGEEFWEHGGFEHGHSHHGEVTGVPLVIAGAGVVLGERGAPAGLADIAPTLLRVAGLNTDGPDLRTLDPADRIVAATGSLHGPHMQSARARDQRVIQGPDGVRAFDLALDPAERTPESVSPEHPVAVAAAAALPPAGQAADVETEQLRTLGYVD